MTPAPLLREERLALLMAEDRVKRALLLGVLFGVLGTVGVALGFGGRPDGWFPFLGVPFVMAASVAYVWWRTRCPRCDRRLLIGRRRLPTTCPTCRVRLVKPTDGEIGPAAPTDDVAPDAGRVDGAPAGRAPGP